MAKAVQITQRDADGQRQDGAQQGLPGKGQQTAQGHHGDEGAGLQRHHRIGARLLRRAVTTHQRHIKPAIGVVDRHHHRQGGKPGQQSRLDRLGAQEMAHDQCCDHAHRYFGRQQHAALARHLRQGLERDGGAHADIEHCQDGQGAGEQRPGEGAEEMRRPRREGADQRADGQRHDHHAAGYALEAALDRQLHFSPYFRAV
jgi:hypothetical protein